MRVDWTFPAESYLDQLAPEEQSKVLHAVRRLAGSWGDQLPLGFLRHLEGDEPDLYSYRVGADLRVIVHRAEHGDTMTVVDVVRRSQIDGLRRRASVPETAVK